MRFFGPAALSLVALIAVASAEEPGPDHWYSPKGGYRVVFEELEHKRFSASQIQEDLKDVSHVRYRVLFSRAKTGKPAAEVEYSDAYGRHPEAGRTPVEELFEGILWSPREDFAVLARERWSEAKGTPHRIAVALSRRLKWKTAPFHLDNLVWAGSLSAVGDVHDDCYYGVNEFNGKTGETYYLKKSRSPIGYEIASVARRKVLIRKVLDNCRTRRAAKRFKEECFSLSLRSGDIEPTACPSE
ncbi:hypothetical protein ACFL2T_05525 [Elusimicrobiota bacterium]